MTIVSTRCLSLQEKATHILVVYRGGHRFGPVRFPTQSPEPAGPTVVIFRPISNRFLFGFFGLRVVRFARVRFGLDGLGYLWPIKFCLNFIFFQHLFYWFGLSFFFNSFFYWFGPLAHFSFLWNFVIFTCSKIQIIPLHHIFYILLILKKKIKTFLDFLY
jgi:hypothetical protein